MAEEFAGVGGDDSDVEVGGDDGDGGSGVGSADSDVWRRPECRMVTAPVLSTMSYRIR